jgi:hypothetical protein
MKKIFWIICFTLITLSCKKEEDRISITNLVKQTQYYENEIFFTQNQKIYGKWELLFTSGGFAGSTTKPTSNYSMEFIPYGIYGKTKDNEITEIGKIRIVKQDNDLTVIDFLPDDKYKTDYFLIQKSIVFKGKDTLILCHYNMSDGYNNFFKRIK